MSRAFGIIIGILTVILGVWCLLTPIDTFGVVGWLITLSLVADGMGKVMVWIDYRKIGVSDTLALVSGILSLALGVVLVCSMTARIAVDVFVAYVMAFWILLGGLVRIARSFRMRDIRRTLGTFLGSNWALSLATGILMTVIGAFCIANPAIVMVALGWQIGFALVAGGIALITATA